jgi:hypothetical protein
MYQADDVSLLPDAAELIWGVVAFTVLIGLVILVVVLVVRSAGSRSTTADRLDDVERRLDLLERAQSGDPTTQGRHE